FEILLFLARGWVVGKFSESDVTQTVQSRSFLGRLDTENIDLLCLRFRQEELDSEVAIQLSYLFFGIANSLQAMDRYPETLLLYEAAEKTLQKYEQYQGAASCQMNRAISLSGLGRYQETLPLYEAAEKIFLKFGQH